MKVEKNGREYALFNDEGKRGYIIRLNESFDDVEVVLSVHTNKPLQSRKISSSWRANYTGRAFDYLASMNPNTADTKQTINFFNKLLGLNLLDKCANLIPVHQNGELNLLQNISDPVIWKRFIEYAKNNNQAITWMHVYNWYDSLKTKIALEPYSNIFDVLSHMCKDAQNRLLNDFKWFINTHEEEQTIVNQTFTLLNKVSTYPLPTWVDVMTFSRYYSTYYETCKADNAEQRLLYLEYDRLFSFIKETVGLAYKLNFEIPSGTNIPNLFHTLTAKQIQAERLKKEYEDKIVMGVQNSIDYTELQKQLAEYNIVLTIPQTYKDFVHWGDQFHNCLGGYEWNSYIKDHTRMVGILTDTDENPLVAFDMHTSTHRIEQFLAPHNCSVSSSMREIKKIIENFLSQQPRTNVTELVKSIMKDLET